ncbi:MAG: hypothetical protein H6767_08315 [Candidatus Peribacteria bacterium]|nr:MAG: hypothetical protein H6767_08315 [Candidatus Peribacteria bacterium]
MSYRITEIIEKTGYALMILQIRHHSHIYRLPIRLYIDEQQKEGIYDHVTHKKPIVSIEHMCVHFPGFDDSEYKHNEEDTMIAQLTTKLGNFIIDNDPDTVDIDSLNSTERMWVDFLIRARLPKAA